MLLIHLRRHFWQTMPLFKQASPQSPQSGLWQYPISCSPVILRWFDRQLAPGWHGPHAELDGEASCWASLWLMPMCPLGQCCDPASGQPMLMAAQPAVQIACYVELGKAFSTPLRHSSGCSYLDV